jgi:HK97 family phage portal protein
MLSWIKRALGGSKATNSGVVFTMAGIPLSQLRNYESYLAAASRKVWACWKALDITAKSVSGTPFAVIREGSTKPVKVPALDQMFRYPNEDQTFREVLYITAMHLKATGTAFWLKWNPTLTGERPLQLFPLNPKRMKIVPDKRTGDIRGYLYHADGIEIPYEAEDIIYFRNPHPDNDYWGLGEIEAGEDLFNQHINHNTWKRKFYKNGAAPSGILILEDVTTDEEAFEKAKAKFQQQYGGVENSGKTAWLTGKWKYEQLGLSAAEMQNIENEQWNVEQIFLQHGVPLSVAGLRDAANYATADIDNQRFKEYTILPLVIMLEDTINTDLVAGWGQNLKLKFNVTGLINAGKVILDWQAAFDRGIISINEFRDKLGLEPDEESGLGDQRYLTAGLVPLELAGVADLQETDRQAQEAVERSVQAVLTTKRNEGA